MRSARFSRGFSDYQIKMAFIMPTMILLILMNIFPLLWSLYLSFHRYKASMPNRPAKFIGVQNYARLLIGCSPNERSGDLGLFSNDRLLCRPCRYHPIYHRFRIGVASQS